MIGLGIGFFCYNNSVSITPTDVSNIDYVELSNGKFDTLYISFESVTVASSVIPTEWDTNTIMIAEFNNTTIAGNIEFSTTTVSDILIKKRERNTFDWHTIMAKKIETVDDFNISGVDYYSKIGDYQYALVPALNGIEGNYNMKDISSDFDGIYIVNKNASYGTPITSGITSLKKNDSGFYIKKRNSKYPQKARTSSINYYSGSVSGLFAKFNESTCSFDFDNLESFRTEIMEFLTDDTVKVLKTIDKDARMISVDAESVVATMDSNRNNVYISFNFSEVGDVNSEKSMYYNNLTDVSEEYWSE